MNEPINPYASPRTIESVPPIRVGASGAGGGPYESGRTRATVTTALLGVGIFADLAAIGVMFYQITLLNAFLVGDLVTDAALASSDTYILISGILQTLVVLTTVIAFLMWFHRAHKNLRPLGAKKLKYSPGWAVGSWFIPIFNWFRPYQIAKEIWQNSDPEQLRSGTYWRASSGILGWWWAAWILCDVLGKIAIRITMSAETVESILVADWAMLVADVSSVIAAVLCILIVQQISKNQDARYDVLKQMPAQPATPPNIGLPPPR